ncbi:MAG: hypothetical protein ACR2J3_01785 [Aridibacter sp.]
MKKSNYLCLILLSVLLAVSVSAQTKKSPADMTLDDYFDQVTPAQFPIFDKYKNPQSLVKEVDYRNQYVLFAHNEWKGWGEMALFNVKKGGHVLAITQYDCTQKNPVTPYYLNPQCIGGVKFYTSDGKKLNEIEGFIPVVKKLMLYGYYEKKTGKLADSDDKLLFILPRERTDIIIKLAGVIVYSLKWNGKGFEGSYVE